MLIKQASLSVKLPNPFPAVFFLIGQELFQLNDYAAQIKSAYCQNEEVDSTILSLNAASDWQALEEALKSYSLFSAKTLIDARFEKKTLDAQGKKMLERIVKENNPHALLLIRAPELPVKQLQFLTNSSQVTIVQCMEPAKTVVLQWIKNRLNLMVRTYDSAIPELIVQYTEGNLLACDQVLKKIELITEAETLTLEEVKEQLVNQCNYSLFELADCCLTGNTAKALQLLAAAHANKTEPTLILWLLTQEVRQLLQLVQAKTSFRDAASQLKIWSQKIALYQMAVKRLRYELLVSLLQRCAELDNEIKTGQNKPIWQSFELLVLALCTGK